MQNLKAYLTLIIFLTLFSGLFLYKFSKNTSLIVYGGLLILISFIDQSSRLLWGPRSIFNLDLSAYWLLIIALVSIVLRILTFLNWELVIKPFKLIFIVNFLSILVCVIFLRNNLLIIYTVFEISVTPIFLIIIGWGYQPERVSAGIAMFFYTAFCSVPLLVIILRLGQFYGSFRWAYFFIFRNTNMGRIFFLVSLIFLAAFLVKLPIFGFHLWLPKAHVEAPVYGSIILAAVLLKLGGLGILRILPFTFSFSSRIFSSIRIFRIALVGVLCIFLFDLKIIVAYSSVAHMSLVILTALTALKFRIIARVLIIITHAFASSALFFGVTKIYSQSNSRSILINPGNLVRNSKFSIVWAFCVIASMATPPLINFFREVLCFISVRVVTELSYIFITLSIFRAGVYSLLIYSSTQHGKINNKFVKPHLFSGLDYLNSFLHLILFSARIFILVIFF